MIMNQKTGDKKQLKREYTRVSKKVNKKIDQLKRLNNQLSNNNKKRKSIIAQVKNSQNQVAFSSTATEDDIQKGIHYLNRILPQLEKLIQKYSGNVSPKSTISSSTNQSQRNTVESVNENRQENNRINANTTLNQSSNQEFARIYQQINRLEEMLQQFDDILNGKTPQTTSTAV